MLFLADHIKQKAGELQIDRIGITPAAGLSDRSQAAYRNYLEQNRQAGMTYLERNIEKRLDPKLLMPEAESIIVILCGYRQSESRPTNPHISCYAQGEDYHIFVKERLFQLADCLAPARFRCFCDTAPVAEKYWAREAGLGYIGRNTLLINPELGSYCFIGIIMTEARFDRYDKPLDDSEFPASFTESIGTAIRPNDQPDARFAASSRNIRPEISEHPCRHCIQCIQACPGQALHEGMDARRCFSYLTIENKGERPPIPTPFWYGCDICQSVCPANRNKKRPDHTAFQSTEAILTLTEESLRSMTQSVFKQQFNRSAIERAGLDGLQKNLAAWTRTRRKAKEDGQ